MLVLTRKKGEAIQIGENIEINIVSIQGDQVKIGIKAPNYVEVHRMEIFKEIQSENSEATKNVQGLLNLLPKGQEK